MKKINNYLIEKLHINKDINVFYLEKRKQVISIIDIIFAHRRWINDILEIFDLWISKNNIKKIDILVSKYGCNHNEFLNKCYEITKNKPLDKNEYIKNRYDIGIDFENKKQLVFNKIHENKNYFEIWQTEKGMLFTNDFYDLIIKRIDDITEKLHINKDIKIRNKYILFYKFKSEDKYKKYILMDELDELTELRKSFNLSKAWYRIFYCNELLIDEFINRWNNFNPLDYSNENLESFMEKNNIKELKAKDVNDYFSKKK